MTKPAVTPANMGHIILGMRKARCSRAYIIEFMGITPNQYAYYRKTAMSQIAHQPVQRDQRTYAERMADELGMPFMGTDL